MSFRAGYLVDISSIKFDDTDGNGTWIQAMPYGKYQHPTYGEINLNAERGAKFVANFHSNVRGQELDIDYDHKEKDGRAAGWVRDAEARADGVWLNVEWTPPALQAIKNKEYKYFSPEFDDQWAHPVTKVVHEDVIFGGALTNRPFLKGIIPINLSEVFADVSKSNEGGSEMALTPERLKSYQERLGLGADATEEDVFKAIDELEFVEVQEPEVEPEVVETPEAIAAKEALSNAKKLAERDPALSAIVTLMEAQSSQLAEQGRLLSESRTALHLSEVSGTVKRLNEKANKAGFAIPIPVRQELESTLVTMSNHKQLSESYVTGIEAILDAKLVSLGEKGRALRVVEDNDDGESAGDKLNKEVKKLTDADKGLSFAEAVSRVAMTNPDLYDEYRRESYAFGGNN